MSADFLLLFLCSAILSAAVQLEDLAGDKDKKILIERTLLSVTDK